MGNIVDYLYWRGDLDFEQNKFNEVDNLILTILSYNDFSGIVPGIDEVGSITLKEAADIFAKTKDTTHLKDIPFLKDIPDLLSKAGNTKRFGSLRLSRFVNQIDEEQLKQFSAVVFLLYKNLYYIAFRGTDDSLVGWKEDLQMSYMEETQSQSEAFKYANLIMSDYTGRFILGGHSKGGNLAVYAASKNDENLIETIERIYNNDGPGFHPNIIASKGYQSIVDRISTFLPESSIVGMLLDHSNECQVVSSSGTAIMQHNPFLWEVKGRSFVYKEGLTKESLNINGTIRSWINQLSMEERAEFVESLFNVLQETGASSIGELSKESLVAAHSMIKAFKSMNDTSKAHLRSTINLLFSEGHKILKKSITEDISSFISKTRK